MRRCTLPSLAALVVLGACSDGKQTPTSPAQLTSVSGSVTGFAKGGVAQGIPNWKKYSDAGIKPGTGRSGSATLEAQVVIGDDGVAVVEASTGSLEAGTSSGSITKVQLKWPGGTKNLSGLVNNGFWSAPVPGVFAGQKVQVQASVRGVDPKRTDVVTVTATAARRPDISVLSVSAPANAPPHAPIMISAVVSELNGDVGARSDCVLSINGVNVALASGIWVDAGGTVSCMFSYSFVLPGSYDVRVTATDVTPGDWDSSNNSAATTVMVNGTATGVSNATIEAQELQYTLNTFTTATMGLLSSLTGQTLTYDYSSAILDGTDASWIPGPMLAVDVSASVDGVTKLTANLTGGTSTSSDDGFSFRTSCTQLQSGSIFASACSQDFYGASPASTFYQAQVASGSVTYIAHGYTCNGTACDTYVENNVTTYLTGSSLDFDPDARVRMAATFWDSNGGGHTVDATTAPMTKLELGPWLNSTSCIVSGPMTFCSGTEYSAGAYLTNGSGTTTTP